MKESIQEKLKKIQEVYKQNVERRNALQAQLSDIQTELFRLEGEFRVLNKLLEEEEKEGNKEKKKEPELKIPSGK